MNKAKILLIGIFGLVAVMMITAAIHLIAPYVAALSVLGFILWIFTRGQSARNKDE
jgi:hypothetical protein